MELAIGGLPFIVVVATGLAIAWNLKKKQLQDFIWGAVTISIAGIVFMLIRLYGMTILDAIHTTAFWLAITMLIFVGVSAIGKAMREQTPKPTWINSR